jgi:hypothetical protein
MFEINLQNIEDKLFFDKQVWKILPEFRHLFDQWQLSKRFAGFSTLGQRSILELLNSLQPDHLQKLKEYFGCVVVLNKFDPSIVKHYDCSIDNFELCTYQGYKEFAVYRKGHDLSFSFWR